MSAQTAPTGLIETRGAHHKVEGEITACAATRDSSRFAFTTVMGDVVVAHRADVRAPEQWSVTAVHDGPALSLSADTLPDCVLTGGDDGRLCRLDPSGEIEELGKSRRWVEHVASYVDGKTALIAAASGKNVELRDATGRTVLRTLEHPTTAGGIVFDPKGKRIAVSHYNGVSVWFTQSKDGSPRLLEWKGSHLSIAMHPAGEAVVTAMQENDLHGWRLSDGHNMRMSGYPTKVRSMSFSHNGKWLATGGADVVVMWSFSGNGPMGKPPVELAGAGGALCTRVAFHPTQDVVAAGFANGTVLLLEPSTHRVLPVSTSAIGAITALAYSPDGCLLGYGTEDGVIGVVDLASGG
ncbi:WD40 repeat domain-containing protein [Acetobacter vaccinii]|uniref:WD40 repeat domain-containing protein n=1 Tax=Acetobacter vaccinii TaxID=2592655 RepID=A0A5C1YME2_9PROT|nr:WD40 repeat domain-containing protein [Acetobacter vaccinii]QEO16688.1 WD40 repeat domain-containing protein [Acetobacter vaccinii]